MAVLAGFAGCGTKPVTKNVTVAMDAAAGGDAPVTGVDPDRTACLTAGAPRAAPGQPCACSGDCSTGTCAEGVCCAGGACGARQSLGAPCHDASECDSGFCADGVCCNVACTGACVSCAEPDQMGQCGPVPAGGRDGHGVCREDPPETCGQSGFCNGQGGCAKHGAGTVCKLAACQGRDKVVPEGQCDGQGVCLAGVAISCTPSTCENNACVLTCTSDMQCMPPALCTNSSCGARGDGQDCMTGSQCMSGKCVDGVCCNSDCAGACMTCALPSARGRCSPTPAGAGDPRGLCKDEGAPGCGSNGRCDGAGACQKYPDGTVCRAASCDAGANNELPAGSCQGGRCNAPAARSCAPYRGCTGSRCATSCGSDSQCSMGVCTSGSCGKRANGASCTRGADCASNECAQGRCCDGPCNGTCKSCSLPGQEGTCANVPPGGADPAGACKSDACSNGCDGAGGCRREAAGTACGAATCQGNTLVVSVCSGTGACESRSEACAGSTPVCRAGRCQMADPPQCTATNCPGPCKVCVADTCVNAGAGTSCPGGSCNGGSCVPSCSTATCTGNRAMCQNGACVGTCAPANCEGPCQTCSANNRNCAPRVNGAVCPGGTCQNGQCQPSPMCPSDCTGPCRTCNQETGVCVTAKAGSNCPGGKCNDAGMCIPTGPMTCQNCAGPCDECNTSTGKCGRKPNGTLCPGGMCKGGECMGALPL